LIDSFLAGVFRMCLQFKAMPFAVGLIMLVVESLCGQSADPGLREKAIAGWKRLDQKTRCTNTEKLFTDGTDVTGRAPVPERWAIQGHLKKSESPTKVGLQTPDFTYILRKNEQGAWQIEQMADSANTDLLDISHLRKAAFSIVTVCLLDAAEDPNFEFSNWKLNDGNLIEFDVKDLEETRLNESGVAHRPAIFDEITIRVDPSADCRVVGFDQELSQGSQTAKVVGTYDYADDAYLPTKIAHSISVDGNPPKDWVWSHSAISHHPLPASEFTLEHYGLSSPLPDKPLIEFWTSIFLGAILLSALALFSVKYVRK
jgi:hypothetical protein